MPGTKTIEKPLSDWRKDGSIYAKNTIDKLSVLESFFSPKGRATVKD